MQVEELVQRLGRSQQVIVDLVQGLPEEQARWRPKPGAWSILEVVNHLYDEEKDDFRLRVDATLHRPEDEWPAIDPPAWCIERRYNERDLQESLDRFVVERKASIAWLQSLRRPDWQQSHLHPSLGPFRAGDLMLSWISHDDLHLKQLLHLHYLYSCGRYAPFSAEYAGGRW